jgi:hypothetical protein
VDRDAIHCDERAQFIAIERPCNIARRHRGRRVDRAPSAMDDIDAWHAVIRSTNGLTRIRQNAHV